MSLKRVYLLLLFLVLASQVEAKSWHGITPLRSNRDDVARTLNSSIDSNAITFKYESPAENVEFVFSGTEDYMVDCVKKLPPGTVLLIEITPKSGLRLSDLGLDRNGLKELESSAEFIINGQAYADDNEGLVVTLREGVAQKIVYIAARQDRHLCASYYEDTRRFTDRIICILCPTIAVSCPDATEAGTWTSFAVNVAIGTPAVELTYHWSVSAGKLVSGQGTSSIQVETNDLAGKAITATVEVGGIDSACSNTASCAVQITPRKN